MISNEVYIVLQEIGWMIAGKVSGVERSTIASTIVAYYMRLANISQFPNITVLRVARRSYTTCRELLKVASTEEAMIILVDTRPRLANPSAALASVPSH